LSASEGAATNSTSPTNINSANKYQQREKDMDMGHTARSNEAEEN